MNRIRLHGRLLALVAVACGTVTIAAYGQSVRTQDYRINDESYASTIGLDISPDIASSQGGFTAVWGHMRPDFGTDVMARLFDESGKPLGAEFRINDDTTTLTALTAPKIARHFPPNVIGNPIGNFAVVWAQTEVGASGGDIYLQCSYNDGRPIAGNIRVDPSVQGVQYDPAIAMDRNAPVAFAPILVAWSDRRNYSDIYARVFSGAGQPSGASFRVNDDTSRLTRSKPTAATGGASGNVVVAWEEADGYVYGLRRVMARILKPDGTPLGPSFKVDSLVPSAYMPSVSVDGSGGFVIAYTSVINRRYTLWAQRFFADGEPNGTPLRIDSTSNNNLRSPDVAALIGGGPNGYGFIVTWEDVTADSVSGNIHYQMFNGQGKPSSSILVANNIPGSEMGAPALALVGYSNVNPPPSRAFVVWPDSRSGDFDIEGQMFNMASEFGTNFRVNGGTSGAAAQQRSAIAASASGYNVAVWQDERFGDGDIVGKRQSRNGDALGPDFRINDDGGNAMQRDPDVAVFGDSAFVVVWEDGRRTYDGDICLQRFNAKGFPIGGNRFVSDTTIPGIRRYPAVASGSNGFIVVWLDYRNSDSGEIFGARFDANGVRLGNDFRIDDDASGSMHGAPAVAITPLGGFVATWADARNGSLDIQAREYDAGGQPLGRSLRINAITANDNKVQMSPGIDISPSGLALIAWIDYRNVQGPDPYRQGDIYGRYYQQGNVVGADFRITDRDTVARVLCLECIEQPPSVAAAKAARGTERDNSFVVGWSDYRNGDVDVYAQWFDNQRKPLANNQRINNAVEKSNQEMPNLARDGATPGGVYFSWDDDRELRKEGWSIWGKIMDMPSVPTGVAEQGSNESSSVAVLPNPLHRTATFSFTIPSPLHVRIEIISVHGIVLATLLDNYLEGGQHHVQFNAGNLAAGAYFYRMRVGAQVLSGRIEIVE